MESLKQLAIQIYNDAQSQNKKNYKVYAQKLTQLVLHLKQHQDQQIKYIFANAFYNLAKLSNRYRFLQTSLQFNKVELLKAKWWLQMLALASSRGSHAEAYQQACKLIQYILGLIQQLKLENQELMFARQINQLIHRQKGSQIFSANALNQLQLSRKIQADCPLVTKTFHIADIMIMETVNPFDVPKFQKLEPSQIFFFYVVYLSIACFTRATQKFYCRQTTDRDFHYKAIEIAGYLYSSKSTYLRFLRRTYRQHYLQHLQQIQEVDEYGDIRIKILQDPEEVSLVNMPWECEEQQQQQQKEQKEQSKIYTEKQNIQNQQKKEKEQQAK